MRDVRVIHSSEVKDRGAKEGEGREGEKKWQDDPSEKSDLSAVTGHNTHSLLTADGAQAVQL